MTLYMNSACIVDSTAVIQTKPICRTKCTKCETVPKICKVNSFHDADKSCGGEKR